MDKKDIDKIMSEIADDLQINAMPFEEFCYEVKSTHQIVRKHLTEQLKLHNVSQQRELLLAFAGWLYRNLDKEVEERIVDDYLNRQTE